MNLPVLSCCSKYLTPLWRLKLLFGYWDLHVNRIHLNSPELEPHKRGWAKGREHWRLWDRACLGNVCSCGWQSSPRTVVTHAPLPNSQWECNHSHYTISLPITLLFIKHIFKCTNFLSVFQMWFESCKFDLQTALQEDIKWTLFGCLTQTPLAVVFPIKSHS